MANNTDDPEESFNDSFVDEPSDESYGYEPEEENEKDKINTILERIQKSGAVIKKSTEKFTCVHCTINFGDKEEHLEHILQHVTLPYIVLERIDDDFIENDDGNWSSDAEKSDEFTDNPIPSNTNVTNISGVTIKSNSSNVPTSLNALKSIGNLYIKKISIPNDTKQEDSDSNESSACSPKVVNNLKLTFKQVKQFKNKRKFEIVNGSSNSVKSETVQEAPQTDTETLENMEEIENEDDMTDVNSDEDKKDGILEKCLNTPIKTEPRYDTEDVVTKPLNTTIKTEAGSRPETPNSNIDSSGNQLKVKSFATEQTTKTTKKEPDIVVPKPMLIPKVETNEPPIIEINCDSDKDDDEIIFVSSSSLPDKKPPIGIQLNTEPSIKEITSTTPATTQVNTSTTSSPIVLPYRNTPSISSVNSTSSIEKQHNFNWNAPTTKANDNWESLLSNKNDDAPEHVSGHKRDGNSNFGCSEYISLETLGPQHTCDICHVRFTSIDMLDNHRKTTGHSNQLVPSTSNSNSSSSVALSLYQQPGIFNNNLLPVKQLADTVRKIASVSNTSSSAAPFTHQQNIMVNIQSFPGNMNQLMPGQQPPVGVPPSYNHAGMGQMPNVYQNPYRMPSQNMNQYPPQYAMPPQQPYMNNSYSQYPMQPSSQSLYNQPNNTQLNQNYPQSYLPNQYAIQPPASQMSYPQTPTSQAPPQLMPTAQPSQIQMPPISVQNVIPLPNSADGMKNPQPSPTEEKSMGSGIKIQNAMKPGMNGPRIPGPRSELRGHLTGRGVRGGRGGMLRGMRPTLKPGLQVGQSIRGAMRPGMMRGVKRPAPPNGPQSSPSKKRMDMLIPDRHDNEDCQVGIKNVVSLQQQRDGLPLIQSIQGSREKSTPNVQLNSQITVTKTKVRAPTPPPSSKDANAVASILASRGIKITQKPKTPPPSINIPNLGSGISVTPASKSSILNFSLPEEDIPCSLCSKTFSSNGALSIHMVQMHSSQKVYRCDSCPISYPTFVQLQEHKLAFHNLPNADIGLPVIDLSLPGTLRKLSNLGITHFVPLANREQGGGCFGLPIISTQSALSGGLNNSLSSLGANGLLSLGPVKPLPKC